MHRTAQNPIFYDSTTAKHALNFVLPLIAHPLHFCFPSNDHDFVTKIGQHASYGTSNRCPRAGKLIVSQKTPEV